MSINSMANAAAARRPDIGAANAVPRGIAEIADASSTTPIAVSPSAPAQENQASATPIDTAFNVLFGYIPTEILTLYVAVLAAVANDNKVTPALWIAFFCFLLATPVVVWLVFGAKLIAARKAIPIEYAKWPVWEMFAATVAFSAWAFALPNSPFSEFTGWYSPALSGVVVLVASTVLGLLAPFFQNTLGSDPG